MDQFNNTKAISPATYLIAGVALLLAGGIISVFADPYLPASLSNTQKGYQSGFIAAQTLVEDSSLGSFFKTQDDVRAVSGTVTAIDGNRITIHDESSAINPFDGPAIKDRTIVIDTNTKIIKLTEKTSAMIKAEMDAYLKTLISSSTPVTTSQPYIQTTVDASSIKIGDLLTVTASENVKTVAEFTAQEIQIQFHSTK